MFGHIKEELTVMDVTEQQKEYHDQFYVTIAAFDPGKNTGLVVVGLDGPAAATDLLYADTVEFCRFADQDMYTYEMVLTRHKPDVIIVEDVVTSGRLNNDKFIQIRAFDRALAVSYYYQARNRKSKKIAVYRAKPEVRKRWTHPHEDLTSPHTRDAYRHIMSWWMMTGQYGKWR